MKKFGVYLFIFLLGWAGAVWSYSDQIYPNSGMQTQITNSDEKQVKN